MRLAAFTILFGMSACVAPTDSSSLDSSSFDTASLDTAALDTASLDTDTDTDPDAAPSYLVDVYRPFLEESCGGCHRETGYLRPPITEDPSHLIGARSLGGMVYVTPGSPEDSLLWVKVADREGAGVYGGTTMPPPDEGPLTAAALAAIEAWIAGGAAP
ncbi:MAG: hypothetical protein Q8P18_33085 [Pseudomonadota bacterium]|nr:hypothetical protein [Pseudomonadota bacterium]